MQRNNRRPTCCLCGDQPSDTHAIVYGDIVCKPCMQDFFAHSIVNESNFPPRWAGKEINPRKYRHVLPTDFLKQFDAKAKEWRCPEQQRVYCRRTDPPRRPEPCGAFLSRWENTKKCRRCEKCMWYTCLHCRGTFSTSAAEGKSASIDHDCDPNVEKQVREQAFQGLIRGKHYQDCPDPDCQKRIELVEACNHITCICGTQFCYVCGNYAKSGQNHWARGGCPMYGQPGKGVYSDDNHDDEDDEDEDDGVQYQLDALRRDAAVVESILRPRPLPFGFHQQPMTNFGGAAFASSSHRNPDLQLLSTSFGFPHAQAAHLLSGNGQGYGDFNTPYMPGGFPGNGSGGMSPTMTTMWTGQSMQEHVTPSMHSGPSNAPFVSFNRTEPLPLPGQWIEDERATGATRESISGNAVGGDDNRRNRHHHCHHHR